MKILSKRIDRLKPHTEKCSQSNSQEIDANPPGPNNKNSDLNENQEVSVPSVKHNTEPLDINYIIQEEGHDEMRKEEDSILLEITDNIEEDPDYSLPRPTSSSRQSNVSMASNTTTSDISHKSKC